MSVRIRRPDERTCERCGRQERFDVASGSWVVADADAVGGVYCIHEWDINGTFVPFEELDDPRADA
ncbi:HEWD family protein [Halobaculum litoreum]|uniref:HEWD family protein n=1 Tax=Halobaculum litoreum TaxID=3031998 RepID=A0ABD5XQ65_9EURY|nr:HEWD family protein [Halobaculum sp. DT92]